MAWFPKKKDADSIVKTVLCEQQVKLNQDINQDVVIEVEEDSVIWNNVAVSVQPKQPEQVQAWTEPKDSPIPVPVPVVDQVKPAEIPIQTEIVRDKQRHKQAGQVKVKKKRRRKSRVSQNSQTKDDAQPSSAIPDWDGKGRYDKQKNKSITSKEAAERKSKNEQVIEAGQFQPRHRIAKMPKPILKRSKSSRYN